MRASTFVFLICFISIQDAIGETHIQKVLRQAYRVQTDPELKKLWEAAAFDFDDGLPDVRFDCDIETSPSIPTSVHELRPGDIKLIGAFGDSITAGNGLGASNALAVAIENRGESWCVGGDETLSGGIVTLTNILKKFNPDIMGYSHCSSTTRNFDRSWLNVAEPGGDNRDMPDQATELIVRMLDDSRVDFNQDWKMFTLFIGGNDLCSSCDDTGRFTPENYGANIRAAVERLFSLVPRVFINLVPMFDVTPLPEFSNNLLCDYLQNRFCDCAVNETTRADLRETQLAYYEQMKMIADDPRYDTNNFAVVLQPHLRDMLPPTDPDTGDYLQGFLSPDCFHPSKLGHQSLAFWLWNTMLTPVGEKLFDSTADFGSGPNVLSCPTPENPYIFTNRNSKSTSV